MSDLANPIPQSYSEWRHCITVDCGISLTRAFINARLKVLMDDHHEETQRFRKLYGGRHSQNVLHWFQQAKAELDS